jgi:hypothetical protein
MGTYSTNALQAGDVLMVHADDRGDITERDGFIVMTASFETMIYLSLFGGNEDDDGSEATEKLQWWGNEGEAVENQYRSKFGALLTGLPVTSGSIKTLEEAAKEDLERDFVRGGYASSITISTIKLESPKRIAIEGFITLIDDTIFPFIVEGDL